MRKTNNTLGWDIQLDEDLLQTLLKIYPHWFSGYNLEAMRENNGLVVNQLANVSSSSSMHKVKRNSSRATVDQTKRSLPDKLMASGASGQFVDQGQTPLLYEPKKLEKARLGDWLKHKIQNRSGQPHLPRNYIFENVSGHPNADGSLRQPKKAKLVEELKDRLMQKTVNGYSYASGSREQFRPSVETSPSSSDLYDDKDSSTRSSVTTPTSDIFATSSSCSQTNAVFSNFDLKSLHTGSATGAETALLTSTCNGNSSSQIKNRKRMKARPQSKPKTIKFHEYKGPPNSHKSCESYSTSAESSIELLLKQQQEFLQWQLEWQRKAPQLILPAPQRSSSELPKGSDTIESVAATEKPGQTTSSSTNVRKPVVNSTISGESKVKSRNRSIAVTCTKEAQSKSTIKTAVANSNTTLVQSSKEKTLNLIQTHPDSNVVHQAPIQRPEFKFHIQGSSDQMQTFTIPLTSLGIPQIQFVAQAPVESPSASSKKALQRHILQHQLQQKIQQNQLNVSSNAIVSTNSKVEPTLQTTEQKPLISSLTSLFTTQIVDGKTLTTMPHLILYPASTTQTGPIQLNHHPSGQLKHEATINSVQYLNSSGTFILQNPPKPEVTLVNQTSVNPNLVENTTNASSQAASGETNPNSETRTTSATNVSSPITVCDVKVKEEALSPTDRLEFDFSDELQELAASMDFNASKTRRNEMNGNTYESIAFGELIDFEGTSWKMRDNFDGSSTSDTNSGNSSLNGADKLELSSSVLKREPNNWFNQEVCLDHDPVLANTMSFTENPDPIMDFFFSDEDLRAPI